jgi:hypothetical protein
LSVTVSPQLTPIFTPIGALCQGATAPNLGLTSSNGITGTWSPSSISTSSAGTSSYIFTPAAGQCASVATLSVTVSPQLTPTFTPIGTLCQGATAPNLGLTSSNGITGTWSPSSISTSSAGTSSYTFTPAAGQCASVATLSVTVIGVNTQVSQPITNTLEALQTAAQYQWLNCQADFFEMLGANNQSFSALQSGIYAVEITYNGCVDTSDCITLNYVAMNEIDDLQEIRIFPNPGSGLYILDGIKKEEAIKVYSSLGQIILSFKSKSTQEAIDLIDFAPGLYVVEGETFRIKIIQQ